MKKRLISVMAILLPLLAVKAQTVKPIPIGSKLPIQSLSKVLNAPRSTIQLSHDKTIILDFFATWCGSCISTLKHLDSLQQQLPDSLQVIVVCYQPTATMAQFLKTSKALQGISLPFVTADTLLQQWFPHKLLPHEVWVHNGTVKAITKASAVTPQAVRTMYAHQPLQLALKNDVLNFNRSVPLAQQLAGKQVATLSAALFTTHMNGLGSMKGQVTDSNHVRVYYINWPLLSLYQSAYGVAANHLVLEGVDTAVFFNKSNLLQWQANNLFCYEQSFPLATPQTLIHQALALALNIGVPYTASMATRTIHCYVLGKPADSTLLKSKTTKAAFEEDSLGTVHINNMPIEAIIGACDAASSKSIFLNETGTSYPIDIQLPATAFNNPMVLQAALERYGIPLHYLPRQVAVLVIQPRLSK